MDLRPKDSLSDRIVEGLIDRIRTNKLSSGDMLPSERELIKEFGVSRLACREALAKMRGMGILEARHGKGVYLKDIESLSVNPTVLRLLQVYGNISNADVLEARLIIEPVAAGLAARQAKQEVKDKILNSVQSEGQGPSALSIMERAQRFTEADLTFHQAVASASGNPVLPMLLKSMHELLWRIRFEILLIDPSIIHRALADHLKIAQAIVNGDANEA
ncbi:MAG TPA: FadR/GntR family transcriptional regulator, partial [Spirochaetia bacterium]|nr:FadR/GntR family transcriptional regulator [Spirochaetia bacterium]